MSLYIPQVVVLIHNYSNTKEQAILSLVCATFYRIIHNIRVYSPKKYLNLKCVTSTGVTLIHTFHYNKLTKIKELKESLIKKYQINENIHIVFKGKIINDEEQFCKFKFQNYECIHLIMPKII